VSAAVLTLEVVVLIQEEGFGHGYKRQAGVMHSFADD